jgi:hypothetical protein
MSASASTNNHRREIGLRSAAPQGQRAGRLRSIAAAGVAAGFGAPYHHFRSKEPFSMPSRPLSRRSCRRDSEPAGPGTPQWPTTRRT